MAWKAQSPEDSQAIEIKLGSKPEAPGIIAVGKEEFSYNFLSQHKSAQILSQSFVINNKEIKIYRTLRFRSLKVRKGRNFPSEFQIFQEFFTHDRAQVQINEATVSAWFKGQKDVSSSQHQQVKEVPSPLNGKVLQLNCASGAEIKKGELICVVEAMKMENKIFAPRDGTIGQVNVLINASVSAGDIIFSYA